MTTSTSAAEAMDRLYRRQRFIYDATRRYYLLGRDSLIANLEVPEAGTALEIGCGTARNLIGAARRYPGARFFGVDISQAMLATAKSSIARAGFQDRVWLGTGDAAVFDPATLFGTEAFDRIFISYSLSMIPDWKSVVRHAVSRMAPGGALLIVDFGDFAGYPALFRRAQLAWLTRYSVRPIAGFEQKISVLAREMGCAAVTRRRYAGYAIEARLQR